MSDFPIGSETYCDRETVNGQTHTPPQFMFGAMVRAVQALGAPRFYHSDLWHDARNLEKLAPGFEEVEVGTLFYWVLRECGTNIFDTEGEFREACHYLPRVVAIFAFRKHPDGRVSALRLK